MAFNPRAFQSQVQSQIEARLLANKAVEKMVELVEEDLTTRLMNQTGVNGEPMPKKKQPQRSLDPTHFLINTGQSWPLKHRYTGKFSMIVTVTRPKILTLPGPLQGLKLWWGVSMKAQEAIRKVVEKCLMK